MGRAGFLLSLGEHSIMAQRKNSNGDIRLDALKSELTALQRDMRLLVEKIAASTGEQLGDATNGTVKNAEAWVDDGAATVRAMIRSQPLAAIALSMSAGAALSLFLRR